MATEHRMLKRTDVASGHHVLALMRRNCSQTFRDQGLPFEAAAAPGRRFSRGSDLLMMDVGVGFDMAEERSVSRVPDAASALLLDGH